VDESTTRFLQAYAMSMQRRDFRAHGRVCARLGGAGKQASAAGGKGEDAPLASMSRVT
jgi:hypothetical protein